MVNRAKAADVGALGEKKLSEEREARDAITAQRESTQQSVPTKVVRFELSSPTGQRFAVDAAPGSEDQLSGWLKSLESGRNTVQ
jgi:hypothetical protein